MVGGCSFVCVFMCIVVHMGTVFHDYIKNQLLVLRLIKDLDGEQGNRRTK